MAKAEPGTTLIICAAAAYCTAQGFAAKGAGREGEAAELLAAIWPAERRRARTDDAMAPQNRLDDCACGAAVSAAQGSSVPAFAASWTPPLRVQVSMADTIQLAADTPNSAAKHLPNSRSLPPPSSL